MQGVESFVHMQVKAKRKK